MPDISKSRVFCWDIDGVLIKFDPRNPANDWRKPLIANGYLKIWEDFQATPAWTECLCNEKIDTASKLREFVRQRDAGDDSARVIINTWLSNNLRLNKGALSLLNNLRRQGYLCVIASNQDGLRVRRLEKWLDDVGLHDVKRFFSCRMGVAKPDKRFYLQIEQSFGREPGDFYLFDDWEEDIEAARSQGWQGQLVRPDLSPVPP